MNRKTKKTPRGKTAQARGTKTINPRAPSTPRPGRPPRMDTDA